MVLGHAPDESIQLPHRGVVEHDPGPELMAGDVDAGGDLGDQLVGGAAVARELDVTDRDADPFRFQLLLHARQPRSAGGRGWLAKQPSPMTTSERGPGRPPPGATRSVCTASGVEREGLVIGATIPPSTGRCKRTRWLGVAPVARRVSWALPPSRSTDPDRLSWSVGRWARAVDPADGFAAAQHPDEELPPGIADPASKDRTEALRPPELAHGRMLQAIMEVTCAETADVLAPVHGPDDGPWISFLVPAAAPLLEARALCAGARWRWFPDHVRSPVRGDLGGRRASCCSRRASQRRATSSVSENRAAS